MTSREPAETKLSYAPVSQFKQHPHHGSLAGKPFRWVVIASNTFFLLLEHNCRDSDCVSAPQRSCLQAAGLHVVDTMHCSGSVLLKDTAQLTQEILRASAAGTEVMGHCVLPWVSAAEGRSLAETRNRECSLPDHPAAANNPPYAGKLLVLLLRK